MAERTAEIPAEQIDRQLTRSPWCVWPECTHLKLDGTMLCHYHVAEAAEYVYNLRALPETTVDAAEVERAAFSGMIAQAWNRRRNEDHSDEQHEALAANIRALERGEKITRGPHPRSYVYFVRVGDLIKIGYTSQPYRRLRAYPPNAEVLGVFPGTRKVEANLHGRFRFALRKGREWYRPAREILDYVDDMRDHYGPPDRLMVDRYQDPGPRQMVKPRSWR